MTLSIQINAPALQQATANELAALLNTQANPSPFGTEWLSFHHADTADGVAFSAGQYGPDGEAETLLHIYVQEGTAHIFGTATDGGRGAFLGTMPLPQRAEVRAARRAAEYRCQYSGQLRPEPAWVQYDPTHNRLFVDYGDIPANPAGRLWGFDPAATLQQVRDLLHNIAYLAPAPGLGITTRRRPYNTPVCRWTPRRAKPAICANSRGNAMKLVSIERDLDGVINIEFGTDYHASHIALVRDGAWNGKGYDFILIRFETYDDASDDYQETTPTPAQLRAITRAMNSRAGIRAVES